MGFVLLTLMGLTGCSTPAESDDFCVQLCDELVGTCGVAAYPSLESCTSGCGYESEQGANIGAHLECVRTAECDTFAIVECDHAHGL
jgi:hypothetical protein